MEERLPMPLRGESGHGKHRFLESLLAGGLRGNVVSKGEEMRRNLFDGQIKIANVELECPAFMVSAQLEGKEFRWQPGGCGSGEIVHLLAEEAGEEARHA